MDKNRYKNGIKLQNAEIADIIKFKDVNLIFKITIYEQKYLFFFKLPKLLQNNTFKMQFVSHFVQ